MQVDAGRRIAPTLVKHAPWMPGKMYVATASDVVRVERDLRSPRDSVSGDAGAGAELAWYIERKRDSAQSEVGRRMKSGAYLLRKAGEIVRG